MFISLLIRFVAPLVGAWIETCSRLEIRGVGFVAPLVGAWIETRQLATYPVERDRRTPRGCVD